VKPGQVEVEQQLVYRIDYEPLRQLPFDIPVLLADSQDWEVSEGDIELNVTPHYLPEDDPAAVTGRGSGLSRQVTVDLQEDRIGTMRIVFRYRLPVEPELLSGDTEFLDIGLVQPGEGVARIEENTLRLHSAPDIEVHVADENWELVTDPSPRFAVSDQPFHRVPGQVSQVAVEVNLTQHIRRTTTKLKRVWLQTWCSADIRRDRVCYQLLADEDFVEFVLPNDVDELEVLVAGRQQSVDWEPGEPLRVGLPDSPTPEYTIELWYFLPVKREPWGPIQTSIPRLVGVERASRLFWEIVVPRTEHLLWPPTSLTPESLWSWRDLHWSRIPNRSQSDLERLFGASTQEPLPPTTNRYLFSSTGLLRTVQFVTAARSVLVIAMSAAALLIGLLLMYVPMLRHPVILIVLGIGLFASAATFPEAAILAAQAAVLGIVLLFVSRILQWTMPARPSARSALVSVSRSGSRTKSYTPPDDGGSSKMPTAVTRSPYQVSAAEPDS
jgi:hypothetical protein